MSRTQSAATVWCLCCQQNVTRNIERAHREARIDSYFQDAAVSTHAPAPKRNALPILDIPPDAIDIPPPHSSPILAAPIADKPPSPMRVDHDIEPLQDVANSLPQQQAWVEDEEEEEQPIDENKNGSEDEDESEDEHDGDGDNDMPNWELFETLLKHAAEAYGEEYERLVADIEDKLSAYDRAICRAFSYKVHSHTTDHDFADIPFAFCQDPPLPKLGQIRSRVAFL
ncbi:hypothetical protein H0H92_014619, partial [Tricholoma furcatifolium]